MDNKTKKLQLNPAKLTPEQRDKLESWNQNKQVIQNLSDMADMMQEFISLLDKHLVTTDKTGQATGALLTDMRESLSAMKSKEAPKMPDYAKPVVAAVSKLETALTSAVKSIEVSPEVNVAAPNVSTTVDLKGVEKILKTEVPKAFKEAIKLIPEVEMPESDYTPLTTLMTEISEKLDSIDIGVRMKQAGVNAKITNTSDITNALPLNPGVDYDYLDVQQTDSDTETYVFKTGGSSGTTVRTIVINYTSSAKTDIDTVEWS